MKMTIEEYEQQQERKMRWLLADEKKKVTATGTNERGQRYKKKVKLIKLLDDSFYELTAGVYHVATYSSSIGHIYLLDSRWENIERSNGRRNGAIGYYYIIPSEENRYGKDGW